jgi:acetoin utilization protein AcuB
MSVLAQVPVPRAAEPTSAAELPVAAVMYPEPIAVRENEPFLATARRMAKLRVRHACVVDDIGRVKGIISERDVRRILGSPRLVLDPRYVPEAARNLRAEQVMKPAHTVNQSVPLREAAWLLLHARVGALPVIDEHGRLRGIVSYVDMLKQLLNEG